jgi:D-alanine-D-alanine ligase
MDKNLANKIFTENDILIPQTIIITREKMKHDFAYPVFVKPISEGSSFELFKFENKEDYIAATDDIFKTYDDMLLQQCIVGREFTCGVIDIASIATALPPTEIILNSDGIFDYKAKYKAGACSEVTPAQVNDDVLNKIKELALKCHKALDCKDFSRTDMIMTGEGDFYVLEINTIPGMTKNSLLPAQLYAAGINIGEFADILLGR